ncbi:MAG TPA: hypothetical protein DCW90_13950 [Lachnospiraceae bacterium]|nr:hypothetical protein [uncultured Lachnoclostridium sp.]HAU86546.1 hypothetical protein [Lachnospiraceae bacterium]
MSRNPNWFEEELKLALELYLSKDLQWHSKISDSTPEVIALSQILNNLDLAPKNHGKNFRSPSSIRLKLANFKTFDERYNKLSLANTGKLDKEIWEMYHAKYEQLTEECLKVLREHFKGENSGVVREYLTRLGMYEDLREEFLKYLKEVVKRTKDFQTKALTEKNIDVSRVIMNSCYDLLKVANDFNICVGYQKDDEKKQIDTYEEHAGINEKPIKPEKKIGRFIQSTFTELIAHNYLTQEDLEFLTSEQSCRNEFHIGHPFIRKVDLSCSISDQIKDANGYIRYWKEPVRIKEQEYCICKEWYESNRKYYTKWLNRIKVINGINLSKEELNNILCYLKKNDEENVYNSTEKLIKKFFYIEHMDIILEKLIASGILMKFHDSVDQLVIEDYDLLCDIIEKTRK